jgi:hypothetical protein
MKVALGIVNKDELFQLMEDYQTGKRRLPTWEFRSLRSLPELMNLEKMQTQP